MCGNRNTFAMNGQQVVKWFAGTATVKPNDVQWISGAEFKRAFPSEARGFNYDLLKLTPIVDNRTYAVGAIGSSVRPITRRVIFVDTDKPTKCGAMCRNAKGPMCDCSCKGENHGASAAMARSRFAIADIDLQPTQEMANNAERGLKLRQQHGRGGTAVGVARARDIKNRKNLSADTVKRMHSFFSRHEGNQTGGEDDAGYIAWLLWGGDSGKAWAARKVVQIEKIESAPRAARKSTMAKKFNDSFTVQLRWNGMGAPQHRAAFKTLAEAEKEAERLHRLYGSLGNPEFPTMKGIVEMEIHDGEQPWKNRTVRWFASRSGKATMAKREYVLWALPKGETDRMHEKPIAYNITKPADMERIKVEATKRGYHSFRVQVIEWARSGAKSAFDAFNPFTAPAKPASWDGKRITLNNKMYKVEPNGGAYDLYDMNTNKKAKTVTAEQLYRAWSQGRITSIYSRFGAKARFADQDLAQELVRVRIGNETVSAREFMNYAKQFVPNVSRNDSLADIVEKVNAALAQRGDKVRTQIVTMRPTYKIPLRIVTRSKMSRFGAKAAFAANNVDLWNFLARNDTSIARQNKNDLAVLKKYAQRALTMPDFTPPSLAQHGPSLHTMAKEVLAEIKAWEEQVYRQRNRAPWDASRSGAKETHMKNGTKAEFANFIVEAESLYSALDRDDQIITDKNSAKKDRIALRKMREAYLQGDYPQTVRQWNLLSAGSRVSHMGQALKTRLESAGYRFSRSGAKAEFSATPHKVTYTDKSGVTHTYMVSDKILRAMNGTKRYAESVGSKPDYGSVLRLGERTGEVVRASRSGTKAQFDLRAKVAQMKTMVSKLVTTLGFKPDEVTGNEQMMHILFLNKPKQADRLAAALRTNLARVGVPNSAITTHENYYADENTTYGGVWIDLTALANAAGKMSRSGGKAEFAEKNSFRDLVAYARFKFNLNLYQAQDVAGRAGLFLQMYPNKYTLEQAMAEALRRSNAQLTTEQKAPNYQVGGNTVGNQSIRDRSLVMSRSGAKAAFAEELIQKLSGGWEIVKIDGILHLAKGNEAIPVPNVQRAMELHKASTEGRLMKENVAGTKTQAFSRVGEEEAFDIGASSDVEDPTKDEQLIALANRVGREHTVNLFKCWSEGKASMGYAQ